jgi:glycosyltransferase involved in cell wall biosynthesis
MVTGEVCSRLAARGHEVEIVGWQQRTRTAQWRGIPVRPVSLDSFGADVLLGYMMRIQPAFVITLADIWWMTFMTDPPVQRYLDQSGARWVLYFPVDGATREGTLPAGWVKMLEAADLPIAMSPFGARTAAACGVRASYIPHGCDPEVFRPAEDREDAKRQIGYGGQFVVLTDARNQIRKQIPRLLDIAAAVLPDEQGLVFHLHTDPDDSAAASELYRYQLREDLAMLGLERRVRLTPDFQMRARAGLPLEELAALYAAADVHLLTSWGEGFGLPTLQAASTGVVPMAVDYSASRELVEGHGVSLPVESTITDEFGLVRALPDRQAAVHTIEELFGNRSLLAELQRRSREFALGYTWDRVGDLWEATLDDAPHRRRPARSRSYHWIGGEGLEHRPAPTPVEEVSAAVFGGLPEGAKVSFNLTERRFGEVEERIRAEAFKEGDYASIPVRLAPLFDGAPQARIGHVLAGLGSLKAVAPVRRLFPGLAVSLPTPPDDPTGPYLSLERLIPTLPGYALVVDLESEAAHGADAACAALGVPFVGQSALWPAVPGPPVLGIRRLLIDQGFSEQRRLAALTAASRVLGDQAIEQVRAIARAAQPASDEGQRRTRGAPELEVVIVRLQSGATGDEKQEVAAVAAAMGGLLLMSTGPESLILAVTRAGREQIERYPRVEFVGGISLDEEMPQAARLKELFAANAIRQLNDRSTTVAKRVARR